MNMRAILFIFCLSCVQVFSGSSTIRECASIGQVRPLVTPETLVVFDIDDTLLHTTQMFGSSIWFEESYNLQKTPESIQLLIELSEAAQVATGVVAMEPKTADEIQLLQKSGACVMAMTSRSSNIRETTARQLRLLAIDFTRASPTSVLFTLQHIPSSSFVDGVLFTSGGHKGQALKEFLRQIQRMPAKIIYLNDRRGPLEEAASSLSSVTEYIGLRYQPADMLRKKYDPAIAEIEQRRFTLLSDAEAITLR